jgi:DNA-binding CsgD family transcriptional regulator
MLARLELAAYNLGPAAAQLAIVLPRRMIRNDRKYLRQVMLDVAWFSVLQRDPYSSARFLGAGEAGQLLKHSQLHHTETFIRVYESVRFQLGSEQFDQAYVAGAALPFEEAAIQATQCVVDNLLATGSLVRIRSSARKALLSPREIEVLRLMSQGKTDREIGESLGIAAMTASTHVKKVLRKLQVTSRTAAVVAATQFGVLSSQPVGYSNLT